VGFSQGLDAFACKIVDELADFRLGATHHRINFQ
jgi:hypothetical protein